MLRGRATVFVQCTKCTAAVFQKLRDRSSAIRMWNHRPEGPMKVWRVYYTTSDGCFRSWHGSKADAYAEVKRMLDMKEIEDRESATVSRVDVPTNKDGLLAWLNAYAEANNG